MEHTTLEHTEYTKPAVSDYGDLAELTAGCIGTPGDFQGLNNSISAVTSKGVCNSTP
jgi:hypothetical protein